MQWPEWMNPWRFPADDDEGNCELLGPFAIVIQLMMGAAAVLSLVYKRHMENPRRPWWTWFFDIMKQILGALGLHFINVLASIVFSSSDEPGLDDNPCNWYFLNILLDTTVGIPVLWLFLYIIHTTCFRLGIKQIVSGQYGSPPQWSAFFKQATLYMMALVCMKIVLYFVVWWMPFMDDLGAFLISWTAFDKRVQVAFVMMVFPLVMNSVQYYIIDTIIQSPEYHQKPRPPVDETEAAKDDNDVTRSLLANSATSDYQTIAKAKAPVEGAAGSAHSTTTIGPDSEVSLPASNGSSSTLHMV